MLISTAQEMGLKHKPADLLPFFCSWYFFKKRIFDYIYIRAQQRHNRALFHNKKMKQLPAKNVFL